DQKGLSDRVEGSGRKGGADRQRDRRAVNCRVSQKERRALTMEERKYIEGLGSIYRKSFKRKRSDGSEYEYVSPTGRSPITTTVRNYASPAIQRKRKGPSSYSSAAFRI